MSSTRLVVTTRETDPVEDVLGYADPRHPLAWLRNGDGVVGTGRAMRLRADASRPRPRSRHLADLWRDAAGRAQVDDPLGLPGTGLVAFGALPFDEESASDGVLHVPEVIVGRHGDRSWVTRIHPLGSPPPPHPVALPDGPAWSGRVGPGSLTAEGYERAVRSALAVIASGGVDKVVLARDLAGSIPPGSDLRRLVRALANRYPDTWTFAVDGLIGASPETLVTARAGTVTARVLAGTAARGADPASDAAAAAALASSAKDLHEHRYAVQSVLASLRPHTRELVSSDHPFLLTLPNLFHLATDVRGARADGSGVLDLVGALHPTAAVAGTPTETAIATIREVEPFDRGRYAGPVGWVDAAGDGEWAIALRCAQLGDTDSSEAIPLTAYAGAGIVAGSDPQAELQETRIKFRPFVEALA